VPHVVYITRIDLIILSFDEKTTSQVEKWWYGVESMAASYGV
jgi:hypothetical protein